MLNLRLYVIIFVVIMLDSSCAEKRFTRKERKEWEKRQWEIEHEDKDNYLCAYRNTFSREQRLKIPPFNVTTDIRLISFVTSSDTTFTGYLPVENHTLNASQVKEMVTLNHAKIDSLTDILYNVAYRGKTLLGEGTGCYDPHNAILFMGPQGEVLEYIEICFSCQQSRVSSENITIGDDCIGKYNLLKDFFNYAGIKIGTMPLKD